MGFSAPVENLTPKSPPLSYKYLSQRGIFWQHLGEVPRKGFPKNATPRGPAYLAGGGTRSAAVPTTRKIAHESMSCDCNPRTVVRQALANFIRSAAGLCKKDHWFTIRGDCHLSLCLLTMLTVKEYACLLLVGGFISTRQVKGLTKVETSEIKIWRPFLDEFNLKDMAKSTKSKVKVGIFKKRRKQARIGELRRNMNLLRIGAYREKGEVSIASKQLIHGIEPTHFHQLRKLRSEVRKCHLAIKPVINDDIIKTITGLRR